MNIRIFLAQGAHRTMWLTFCFGTSTGLKCNMTNIEVTSTRLWATRQFIVCFFAIWSQEEEPYGTSSASSLAHHLPSSAQLFFSASHFDTSRRLQLRPVSPQYWLYCSNCSCTGRPSSLIQTMLNSDCTLCTLSKRFGHINFRF